MHLEARHMVSTNEFKSTAKCAELSLRDALARLGYIRFVVSSVKNIGSGPPGT